MLNHFLRLLGRAAEDFPSLLGGNWVSLFLPMLVYSIKEGNALRRGWSSMSVQFWKDTKILGCIYVALFVWAVIHTTYRDHMELAGAVVSGQSKLAEKTIQLTGCTTNLGNAGNTIRDKQSLVDTLQKTMVSMQGPQAQQQANIGSCISNLAKMNPIIREKISVIPVGFGTQSATGRINDPKGLIIAYLYELFIITNEPERNFSGDLKCSKDFTFINNPDISPRDSVMMIMKSSSPPKLVASNEYLITVESTGIEWNPSHPAFMTVRTTEKDFGCTFTPQE
jgi:hypothetical protein